MLENTTIECDDALTVIKRFDIDKAFFFVDPPYVGCNMGHYSGMFNEQNLNELLQLLSEIKGKFMLTMYPNEIVKEHADSHNWRIKIVDRVVTASISTRRRQQECIVMNF